MKKKMIVCGDSYMTPVITYPNTHLAELTADVLDYHLTVYARGGMSNLGICLQIEEAIKKKPDLILFNTTHYDRTEIPLNLTKFDRFTIDRNPYTMQDIIYEEQNSVSTYLKETNKNGPNFISDTLHRLLKDKDCYKNVKDIPYIRQAVRYYFEFLHDPVWQRQKDLWSLYACIHRLHESKIPYVYLFPEKPVLEYCPFIDEKHTLLNKKEVSLPTNEEDPGYHTTPVSQFRMSRTLIDYIRKTFE